MVGPSLIDHFAALHDPRQSWKVLFPLPEVLLVVLCGTLAGAEDFVEIRRWGQMHHEFLRRLLPFKAGVPSHDTLNDVINAIDGVLFAQCFTAWVEDLREPAPASAAPEIVAIDGKTSRRTHDRSKDRGPLHLVSAWASSQRLVLGQQACEAKSNEITAIPLLLERLALTGALVTIDAMGTQTRIAQAILDRGGACSRSRTTRPVCTTRSGAISTTPPPNTTATSRRPTPTMAASRSAATGAGHEVDWLTTVRRFPGWAPSPWSSRGRAQRQHQPERRKLFAVRCHWHVENRLHWVLDVVFHEDLSRLRSGAGPQNMATVRHLAMNLLRTPEDKHSLKVRRKSAAWDTSYLEALIRQLAEPRSSDRRHDR